MASAETDSTSTLTTWILGAVVVGKERPGNGSLGMMGNYRVALWFFIIIVFVPLSQYHALIQVRR